MGSVTHDATVHEQPDGSFTASCGCGWRAPDLADSSTGWSHAKDHVVAVMDPQIHAAREEWPNSEYQPSRSTDCAYCAKSTGDCFGDCCEDCRTDSHAHCPSWPSCTRADYGKPCRAETAVTA